MLVIVLLNLLSAQLYIINLFNVSIRIEVIVQTGLLLFVSLINYQGLRNPRPFQQISESDIALSKAFDYKIPLPKTDKQVLQNIAANLSLYMKVKQPYLNPELNITTLAFNLGVTEKLLSQTINSTMGVNFSDYINSYRIEFVREKLEADKVRSLSIKEIMYEAGFNSRSVFNTAFKKKTGLTPSEYQKYHN